MKFALSPDSLFVRRKKLFAPLCNTAAILLLALILNFTVTKNTVANLIWTCCVFAIMAASLNITMGFMGQLALGHCGFMAVGAYLGTYMANAFKAAGFYDTAADGTYFLVFLLALLLGGVGAALIGFLVGMPALRLRGDYLAIITLGFGLIVVTVLNNIVGPVLYAVDCGLAIPSSVKKKYLIPVVLVTAGVLAILFDFVKSRFGRALESIRDDDIAAAASGVNTSFYKVLGFSFSAFFAGIAGVLYAAMMSSLSTASFAFSSSSIYNSIFIVVMVVLGGMGSLTGSIVSGVGMVLANNIITSKIPADLPLLGAMAKYPMLLYALVLIIFIMFRPMGIFGRREFSLHSAICKAPTFFGELPGRIRAWGSKKEKDAPAEGESDGKEDA